MTDSEAPTKPSTTKVSTEVVTTVKEADSTLFSTLSNRTTETLGSENNARSHKSKRTSKTSSYQTLTSSQRKLEAKASKKRLEELQRQCEQELKLQQAKADLEQKKLELESDSVEKAKTLAREEQKVLLAEIHEENRRKVEEERQKAKFLSLIPTIRILIRIR